MVKEGLIPYRKKFRESKKQKSQIEIMMYFSKVTLSVPASPAFPSTSPAPPTLPPLRQQDQLLLPLLLLSPLNMKTRRMKNLMNSTYHPTVQLITYLLYVCESLCVNIQQLYGRTVQTFLCYHHGLNIHHVEHHVQDVSKWIAYPYIGIK